MMATLTNLYDLAQSLSAADRLALAQRLLEQSQIEVPEATPQEIEAAWAEEAAIRDREMDENPTLGSSLEEFEARIAARREARGA